MGANASPRKVRASSLIIAAILLAGIVTIAYGHFQSNALALYAGLAAITIGVLSGVVRIVTHGRV